MMTYKKQLKIIFTTTLLFLGWSIESMAASNKFDFGVGYYSISAKTATQSGSLSGLGLYHLNYRRAITPKIEFAAGYTIYFTGIIGGDSGSGVDLGINYFPFADAQAVEMAKDGKSIYVDELYRPYVGVTFDQRSFQSVQSSYSGFGLLLGLERTLTDLLSLNFSLRYMNLSGGVDATATEMDFLGGFSIRF
jgi:hypothetical protein